MCVCGCVVVACKLILIIVMCVYICFLLWHLSDVKCLMKLELWKVDQ